MKRSNVKRSLFVFVFSLLFAAETIGQEFWEKKPYQTWSEEEARRLLSKSPWAQEKTFTEIVIQSLQSSNAPRSPAPGEVRSDPSTRADVGSAREARPTLKYQVQFRSALPVRQAIARIGQIKAKYDELTEEQKKVFDRDVETFISKPFPDSIILYVSYSSNVPGDDRELAGYWHSQTTDTLKNFVFLILPGGEKVPLSLFTVAKGAGREFQFVFPRIFDGNPVIHAGVKTMQLEFPHPRIRDQKESRVLISFKTEKMFVNGVAVY